MGGSFGCFIAAWILEVALIVLLFRSDLWATSFLVLFVQRFIASVQDRAAPVKTQDEVQIKGRGLYINALSHGAATPTHRLLDTWPFGLLNILSAPDTKGWSSQVVDVVDGSTPLFPAPPGTSTVPYPSSVTNVSSKNNA